MSVPLDLACDHGHGSSSGRQPIPSTIANEMGRSIRSARGRAASDVEKLKLYEELNRAQQTLRRKTRMAREMRAELTETRQEVEDIQRRLQASDQDLQQAKRELEKYKSWWMNEYCFVRVLLQMVPDPAEVEVVAASSHGRFAKYCEN